VIAVLHWNITYLSQLSTRDNVILVNLSMLIDGFVNMAKHIDGFRA
jgi:hypothetical protein